MVISCWAARLIAGGSRRCLRPLPSLKRPGSLWIVSLLHIALGLGAAASFGPLIADVSQWFLRRRGIAVAIAASGNYLAGTVWPTPIAWIMDERGWQGAYLALALAILVIVVPGALLLRRQIDAASTERATTAAAHKAATLRIQPRTLQILLAIAGVGCCTAMSMPQVHIVALCIDRGFGPQAGAEMLSLMLAGGVASRLFFGAVSDKLGGLMVLAIGGTLQMLALSLFLIQGDMLSLYLISLIFGLSQGGIVPAYAIIVREYMPPLEAGRRVGIVMGATILGMAFGGWITGWLERHRLEHPECHHRTRSFGSHPPGTPHPGALLSSTRCNFWLSSGQSWIKIAADTQPERPNSPNRLAAMTFEATDILVFQCYAGTPQHPRANILIYQLSS